MLLLKSVTKRKGVNMRKLIIGILALTLVLSLNLTAVYAATQNSSKASLKVTSTTKTKTVQPLTVYDWTVNNIGINGNGVVQFLGPSGNNYLFNTDEWPSGYFSEFEFQWSGATSGASFTIKAIDTSDNSYSETYASGSSGTAYVTGLKDANYEVLIYNDSSSALAIQTMTLTTQDQVY